MQKLLLLCTLLLALCGCHGPRATFYAYADLPYSELQVEKLKRGVEDINRDEEYEFSIHLGDIKSGKDTCEQLHYRRTADILKNLKKPVFIIPGDNEWNDCAEPDAAWQLWEEYFLEFEKNWPGGGVKATRQPTRPENFAFVHRRCLFIGLNLVGSKMRRPAEWKARLADNKEWLQQQFAANRKKVKCAVVFGHAQPRTDRVDPNQTFFDVLKETAADFGKPTLYMHGDGHNYEMERFLVGNLLRLELNGGKENDWLLKVVVEPGKAQPFTFILPIPPPEPIQP